MTVDRKLRLRLELIAALPEPILLDRLRRLSQAELIAFRRRYGYGYLVMHRSDARQAAG